MVKLWVSAGFLKNSSVFRGQRAIDLAVSRETASHIPSVSVPSVRYVETSIGIKF